MSAHFGYGRALMRGNALHRRFDAGRRGAVAGSERAGRRGDLAGRLRAAAVAAQDGLVATASLLVGVAAAGGGRSDLAIVGLATLAAGALAMAAGECVAAAAAAGGAGDGQAEPGAARSGHPGASVTRAEQDRGDDPAQALSVGACFAAGAGLPWLIALVAPTAQLVGWLVGGSLLGLGAFAAIAPGEGETRFSAALRAAFAGGAALAVASALGCLFGPLA